MDLSSWSISVSTFLSKCMENSQNFLVSLSQFADSPTYKLLAARVSAFFTYAIALTSAILQLTSRNIRIFMNERISGENIQWLYSIIFESNFLPYASYSLMGCSIFCIFLVLHNVSISYPEITYENESKKIDNIEPYEFPTVSTRSPNTRGKSSLSISRLDRPVREDLRNFITVKVMQLVRTNFCLFVCFVCSFFCTLFIFLIFYTITSVFSPPCTSVKRFSIALSLPFHSISDPVLSYLYH